MGVPILWALQPMFGMRALHACLDVYGLCCDPLSKFVWYTHFQYIGRNEFLRLYGRAHFMGPAADVWGEGAARLLRRLRLML